MTSYQESIIICAYLDLLGAEEEHATQLPHDWKNHNLTIKELRKAFPEIINERDQYEAATLSSY
jgi:hypothetical protein